MVRRETYGEVGKEELSVFGVGRGGGRREVLADEMRVRWFIRRDQVVGRRVEPADSEVGREA